MALDTLTSKLSPRGVATITLNRPEKGNAFNNAMLRELRGEFQRLDADEAVRVIVLAAAGRHFCVGADLGDREAERVRDKSNPDLTDVLETIDTCGKPTIAVVQGGCIGGGLAIALCCDILLATDAAFFSIPEARLGFISTLVPLFVRAMGSRAFRRYGLTGERIAAGVATQLGLVHQLCDAASLESELDQLTDACLLGAPRALRETKALAAQHAHPSSRAVFPPPDQRLAFDHQSAEAREGVAAFREKRKPRWYRAP